jgi:TolA-binding protein
MYSIDENGKHSLEISYQDSDGVDVGAYAEGDKFEKVIFDAIDQIDEAIAEYGDDQADVEEAADIQKQIAELQAKINELQTRNNELEKRHAEKINHKPVLDDDLKNFLNNFCKNDLVAGANKVSDFPFAPKWWA